MAQYTTTCTCGHEYTFNLYGPMRDRERKLEWLAGQPCPKCRAEAKRKAAAEAAEKAAADKLPALVGTETDVATATQVRAEIIDDLDRDSLVSGARAEICAEAARHTAAVWWISDSVFSTAPHDRRRAIMKAVIVARWCALSDDKRAAALALANDPQYRDSLEAGWALEAEKARLARLEAAPVVPAKPATLQARLGRPGARWNNKFYGREGLRAYLDGEDVQVPAAVKAAWTREWREYNAALAALHDYNVRAAL